MRKIYTIGETVFDIIFKNNEPVTAKPGGGMLNAAVSLGRLNMQVSLISEFAYDSIGTIVDEFLQKNGVSTRYIYRYKDGKSPVSLAFLDENNNAGYSFYKIYSQERLKVHLPDLKQDDIVLFGSFYAITEEIRHIIKEIILKANANKAIVIYDPNFRESHLSELATARPLIHENISLANIVHGSNEDFNLIFGAQNVDDSYRILQQNGCQTLIYTANKHGTTLRTHDFSKFYEVPGIDPVSTIGAGDSFNAGIIYALIKNNVTYDSLNNIGIETWDDIVYSGICMGTHVCTSFDNYISNEFADLCKDKPKADLLQYLNLS